MAVRRTLKQKQKAQLHRSEVMTYALPATSRPRPDTLLTTQPGPAPVVVAGPSLHEIFGYEPKLLWQDILKTLLTSMVVGGILLLLKYLSF